MGLYDRQESFHLDTNISICIVGLGGIGFWVAKFAAMSGIGKIHLYDPDVIDETNLNRISVPIEALGMNKTKVAKRVINAIRPECIVYSLPFILQPHTYTKTDWIIDCTDKIQSQIDNQKIAKMNGSKYLKAGYNGLHITISNSVAEWGEAPDGYTIDPSWVVPSTIVASLTISKILKYHESECSLDISNIFK